MTTVNSLSSGASSSFMGVHYPADLNIFACVCIDYPDAAPKDKAVLDYCLRKLDGNFIASAEDEKSLKVMMQLEQLLGKEIVWVRGKSFDQLIDEAGCLPTWARRFCTTELKIRPIFEYVYFRYGHVNENIGIRYDEFDRAYKIEKGKKPEKKVKAVIKDYPVSQNTFGEKQNNRADIYWADKNYPMINDMVYIKQIADFWRYEHPEFEFPEDNNCQGCHHKSPFQIKKNYMRNPPILTWFSLQEKKGKYNTWHDDDIPYEEKFFMDFTGTLDFGGQSCDTGHCTD